MRSTLRSFAFGLATLLGAGAMAQNVVIITGSVQPCNGISYPVQIHLNSVPPIDTVVYTGPNCDYSCTLFPVQSQGVVTVSTTCDGGVTYMSDSSAYNPFFNTVVINLACGGGNYDCMGILNGPNVAGTPCDDGIPATDAYWTANCDCVANTSNCNAAFTVQQTAPWTMSTDNVSTGVAPMTFTWWMPDGSSSTAFEPTFTFTTPGVYGICLTIADVTGCSSTACDTVVVDADGNISNTVPVWDCLQVLNGPNMPGTPCTVFGTVLTGIWSADCVCIPDSANTTDCLGVINGPNVPGAPCDDNDPLTANSAWNANCECVAVINVPCEADFWVMQAYTDTTGNPNGGGVPVPNVLWVWNLSSGGTGNYQFLWSFGDGTSSTDPFPTHTYADGGPYLLCLTISDDGGCTDTYCDSISVDENGMISGMGTEGNVRSTFTINVINPLTTSMPEKPELEQLATWPNPVTDELNIQLTSRLSGSVNLDILDLSGRTVLAGNRMLSNGANRLSLPTGDLNPGMYLLRIGNGGEAQVLRFVKTR